MITILISERVRRKYSENRPYQPRILNFSVTYIGGVLHIVFYLEIRRMPVTMHLLKNGWNTFHKKERLRVHVEDEFIDL
jgi:hypothetical protein